MDEKESKVIVTTEEVNKILRNLPGIVKELEKKIKVQENNSELLKKQS